MTDNYVTTAPLAARMAIHRYGTNPVPWYDFVRALLPQGRLVDVGAGTGALWEGAARDVVATDSSAAMCAALRAAGLRVARADATALPFGDGTFDGAVCNHVLYHLAEPSRGLAELRRVVRPGGWVAVATNGDGHMAEIVPGGVHEHFPAEGLAEAMGEYFADVTLHRYDDELLVPEPDPVVAYAASVGVTLDPAGVSTPFRVSKHTVLATAR